MALKTNIATLVLGIALVSVPPALAESGSPFTSLEGQWTGNGTIELSGGSREPIKCRAAFDLPAENTMQLDLRCASDSYNFELRASATASGGTISGTWSEATRNAAGTISGTADAKRFQVLAKGPAFTANLTVTTQGDRQTIDIQSQDQKTSVKSASIALQRRAN